MAQYSIKGAERGKNLNSQKGTFIAFEGTDGSGKLTQSLKLSERLSSLGYQVAHLSFPRYKEPSSLFVRKYLYGEYGDASRISPYAAALFYALDRYDAAKEIKVELDKGTIVIADRFSASNMAHQGVKFNEPETRKGFYLWVDNLEHELLKIPRPHLSVIMRVGDKQSRENLEERDSNKNRPSTKDIHETDQAHTAESIKTYDELSRLFTKDFTVIDCVRNGKMLDIVQVSELVWGKVKPLLPEEKNTKPIDKKPVEDDKNQPPQERLLDKSKSRQHLGINVSVPIISIILAQHLLSRSSVHAINYSHDVSAVFDTVKTERNLYFVPDSLDKLTESKYCASMDAVYETIRSLSGKLESYLSDHNLDDRKINLEHSDINLKDDVIHVLSPLMPLATTGTLDIFADVEMLSALAKHLKVMRGSEAVEVSEILSRQVSFQGNQNDVDEKVFARKVPNDEAARHAGTDLAYKKPGRQFSPVELDNYWPRNELEIIPYLLFNESNNSIDDLKNQVASWPIQKKYETLDKLLSALNNRSDSTGDAMENIFYSLTITSEIEAYQDFLNSGYARSISSQSPKTIYGYHVPKIITDASLDEEYEKCFEYAQKLYSTLETNGYEHEAQYAVLLGNRVKWHLTISAQDAVHLLEYFRYLSDDHGGRKLFSLIKDKIAEVHPVVAEKLLV